jgi:polar amino acid transport system permease protein
MDYALHFGTILSGEYLQLILSGAKVTLELFSCAWILGLVLAISLTVLRSVEFKPTQFLVAAFVEYHRNVPLLIQLFVWYFGLASLLPDSINDFLNDHGAEMGFAIIALALNKAAYMSEDFRSGLRAIPVTQFEAGRSIGLSYLGSMRHVILPQAWRLALPALLGQTLFLFKATSLAAAIGVADLSYQSKYIESQSFLIFEVFTVVTLLYMIGSYLIMWAAAYLAARFKLRTK